jgi:metallophosphoesterase (TIGR03767 family)
VAAAFAAGRPQTTLVQTILDRDGDNRLEPAPGEAYVVRPELGEPLPGREDRRVGLIFFGQMTDFQMVDEESPARVEFLDKFHLSPFTSAYRPHEGLSPQIVHEMTVQLRNTESPVMPDEKLELVMTTGDNTDNTQLNETRWVIDILDGGIHVDPDSGIPGTCGTLADRTRYDGVRNQNEYYEPDRSTVPGADTVDGPGYSPDVSENLREAGRSSSVRDFPGLFEAMNRRFRSVGLGVPWYSIFGNHDGLVQGNQPRNVVLDAIATGCIKVQDLSPGALARIAQLAEGGLTPAELFQVSQIILQDIVATVQNPNRAPGDLAVIVPQDPNRHLLRKNEYILQHFATSGVPVGHGFTPENVATGTGNYAFSPKPGLRFVVLDSVAELGGENGNIDHPQFQWLHAQLAEAEAQRQLVVVFSHHSLRTMNQPPISPFPPGDQGGNPTPVVHFGLGFPAPTPCALADPATPPPPTESLRCLLLRHRGVVALVNGHEHENRIAPWQRFDALGQADGGFWEITTASHLDWPQQSRVLDLVDNLDGNLSIFATIVDHGAPPNPGGAPPSDGKGAASASVSRLASIARELAYNDPDARNGEDGRADARGTRLDRNVELLIRNPYEAP